MFYWRTFIFFLILNSLYLYNLFPVGQVWWDLTIQCIHFSPAWEIYGYLNVVSPFLINLRKPTLSWTPVICKWKCSLLVPYVLTSLTFSYVIFLCCILGKCIQFYPPVSWVFLQLWVYVLSLSIVTLTAKTIFFTFVNYILIFYKISVLFWKDIDSISFSIFIPNLKQFFKTYFFLSYNGNIILWSMETKYLLIEGLFLCILNGFCPYLFCNF